MTARILLILEKARGHRPRLQIQEGSCLTKENPKPGTRGTLGQQTMELPGNWSFDAALLKSVRLTESKSLQFRMDSTNVFNHPVPSNPIFNINGNTPFGSIQDKRHSETFLQRISPVEFLTPNLVG